eukprot:444332-Amphidinium_carterae.1
MVVHYNTNIKLKKVYDPLKRGSLAQELSGGFKKLMKDHDMLDFSTHAVTERSDCYCFGGKTFCLHVLHSLPVSLWSCHKDMCSAKSESKRELYKNTDMAT